MPAANSGPIVEIRMTPEIAITPEPIQNPKPPQKPQYDPPKLEYQPGLIARKEQDLRLRSAKVTQRHEDKVAALVSQIFQKPNEEYTIRTEDQARTGRMEEIERLKATLDQCQMEERVEHGREGMLPESFEEDAERINVDLSARIERLKAGEPESVESEQTSTSHETQGKRKTALDDISEPPVKKPYVLVPSSQPETESGADSRDSLTVGRSTQSQATLPSSSAVTEAASNPDTPERPEHNRTCQLCGKNQPRSVRKNGKGIRCECISIFKVLWEVNGGVDGMDDQESESDDETVGWRSQDRVLR